MVTKFIFGILGLMAWGQLALAGTIANGMWSPSHCGIRTNPPVVANKNVGAFNQSVKDINDWQKKVNDYNSCVVKEANADNDLIAKAANAEQARFSQELEKIKNESSAAKEQLDKQR